MREMKMITANNQGTGFYSQPETESRYYNPQQAQAQAQTQEEMENDDQAQTDAAPEKSKIKSTYKTLVNAFHTTLPYLGILSIIFALIGDYNLVTSGGYDKLPLLGQLFLSTIHAGAVIAGWNFFTNSYKKADQAYVVKKHLASILFMGAIVAVEFTRDVKGLFIALLFVGVGAVIAFFEAKKTQDDTKTIAKEMLTQLYVANAFAVFLSVVGFIGYTVIVTIGSIIIVGISLVIFIALFPLLLRLAFSAI